MTNYMIRIKAEFEAALRDFEQSPPMIQLAHGEAGTEHYKAYLRQIFHHTRENPQLQVLASVYFRGRQRNVIKKFFAHAASEIGHDQLALDDLAQLSDHPDIDRIRCENPLPATIALISFAFYQICGLNPVGYLGYLFFLEFTPTSRASQYIEFLKARGIPDSAMTFLRDHGSIDVGHNKMMESYVEELVTTEEDFQSVVYAMKVTGKLYAGMIQAAFEQVHASRDFGISGIESRLATDQGRTHSNVTSTVCAGSV